MGFELCERVSPRTRACTPLMAPSGYSRRTLSYLLFSAGCPEEARGKGRESAGEERGDGKTCGRGGKGVGTTIYPQTSHTSRSTEFRRIRFREWKLREINADGVSYEGKQGECPGSGDTMLQLSRFLIFRSQIC